ncbi:ROK family protein [Salinibacter altiplanensis]|uniref:ROK family protein n=1 Tax=Salinibacter altiplanensis TaxID=1803181 RepID=UPI0012FFFE96|nr:ROK family protein [Salinibacter altiplanensis]
MSSSSSASTLGIDIGGTKIETALVDASGAIQARHRHPTNARQGARHVLEGIATCVEECLSQSAGEAVAAGVGVAGQVDAESGVVRSAPNLGWTDVPLQAHLHDALGLPVTVTNDVRAVTWGVWRHGAGRSIDDLVVVFVGTGIGGGVVSGGQVLAGHRGLAGELGHTTIMPYGRACHCRNRGCWEAYAGGWALEERAQEAVRTDPDAGAGLLDRAGGAVEDITGRTVHAAFEEGDPLAKRLVDATAEYLGLGLVGVVNAFNPQRVVMGGGMIEGHPPYVDRAAGVVRRRALGAAVTDLEVVASDLGGQAGVVGAATVAHPAHRAGGPRPAPAPAH